MNKPVGKLVVLVICISIGVISFPQAAYCRRFFFRGRQNRRSYRSQPRSRSSYQNQPRQNSSNQSKPSLEKPSPQSKPSPARSNQRPGAQNQSSGLTADEIKVRQRRQQNYEKEFGSHKREDLDPQQAAKVGREKAKNTGKEGQEAYSATLRKDVERYKNKKMGVSAVDVIDPKSGAELRIRLNKENGRNVYDVLDKKTGFVLHEADAKQKQAIAVHAKGLKIRVGYGDPNNPEWASKLFYPTNVDELNVFAGFNRDKNNFIRTVRPVSDSPSDEGYMADYPIRYNAAELKAFAQAKDSYTNTFSRPELAALARAESLTKEVKLRIAEVMLENSYGKINDEINGKKISSMSDVIKTITRSDSLGDGFQRTYDVHGARNYQGKGVYVGIETVSRAIKPESQQQLKKLIDSVQSNNPANLNRIEKLVPKPLPQWIQSHKDNNSFAWFPKRNWEDVVSYYGESNIKLEKLQSYTDQERGSIFHEVKIIHPNADPNKITRENIMLFRLDN